MILCCLFTANDNHKEEQSSNNVIIDSYYDKFYLHIFEISDLVNSVGIIIVIFLFKSYTKLSISSIPMCEVFNYVRMYMYTVSTRFKVFTQYYVR